MDVQERVTDSVRALAAWKRETSADVAAVLGLSKSSANGKMIGRVTWTLRDMERLCEHYGVTFEQLTAGPAAWLGLTPSYVLDRVAA
jgi:hypothetical protein